MLLSETRAPVVRTSLTELVYERLLADVLSGELPSGTSLNAADIAIRLDVSPSPVREAILRLAAEGLATAPTNRRTTVISFSPRDVREIFALREILECGAVRLAAREMTDARLDELRRAAEECAALYGDPSRRKQMLELDNRFHMMIAELTGNRVLRDEILRVSRRVRVMQWLRLAPARMVGGLAEHMAVLEGFRARDPEATAKAMSAHIQSSCGFVLEGVDGGDGRDGV